MKILINIIRIIVGVLFIFSGLVKANDPAGLSYKMHEFFDAWGLSQFNSWALTLSVLMIAFEIIAGIALLVGWQKKWTLWLLLVLILFFTFLTGYALLAKNGDGTLKFKACGCFGDCIPLKPSESFTKDILLLVMILVLLIFQKYIHPIFKNNKITWAVMLLATAASFLIQKYTLDHLPFKDCLSFKVGNNILEKKKVNAGEKKITMIHKKEGKEFSYEVPNYPEWIEDSTYVFDRREEKVLSAGNLGDIIMDFTLNGIGGSDSTVAILSQEKQMLLVLITDIEESAKYSWEKDFEALTKLAATRSDSVTANNEKVYIVTNKATEARTFFKKYNVSEDHVLFCDEKPLLAAARTRPTLLKVNKGTIQSKLSYKDWGKAIKLWKVKPFINL